MAVIDSKKLLPPSKSVAGSLATQKFLVPVSNIIPKSSAIIKAPQSSLVPSQDQGKKTLSGEIVSINKKALRIEEIISINTNLFKKAEENKRKSLEDDKFEKKEKQLEEKKGISFPGIKGPSLPRTGFLDSIKRFLLYTMLGYAFNKFGKYIPKVIELTTKLTPVFKFFEDFTGNLLNGVIDFIGAGYKAYDKVKEITKFVGGENAQKKFDEFSKQFNTFANLAIIAGMATMGGANFSRKEKPGFDRVSGRKVDKPTQARYLQRYGKSAYTGRFGKQSLNQLSSKGAGRLAGRVFGRVPIIGGLIDFIVSTVIFKEKPGRAAAKAVGATIGSALGTFIPVPFAGTILGGILGDIVGGALYDSLVGSQSIQGRAKGGEVTRGGKRVARPAVRRIQQIKTKPPKIRPQKTIPGKDIGGKKEIEKLFPTTTDPKTKNPLGILETTSNSLKQLPMIGGLMGASLDLVMGQKPDRSVFAKIGNGFGVLIQNAINAETSTTLSNVQKEIVGLANGGTIPRTLSSNENIGMKIGERIARTLETMVNVKVNETLQALRKEFGKKGFGLIDSEPDGGGGPGGGQIPGDAPPEVKAMLEAISSGEGGWDSVNPGTTVSGLSNMTIADARKAAMEKGYSMRGSGAMGKWQQMPEFILERARDAGLDPNKDKFSPENQTKIARMLMASVYPGGEAQLLKDARQDPMSAAAKLRGTWPSLPGGSQANTTEQQFRRNYARSLQSYRSPELGTQSGSLSLAKQLAESMGVPLYSHVRKDDPKSYHYDGRAMDFSNDAVGNGTPQQLALAKELVKRYGSTAKEIFYTPLGFSIKDGKRVAPIAAKGHYNHVHVAFAKGGKVSGRTEATLAEEGPEFVLDTNTTLALEQNFPGFLDSLNKADYKGTLQVLSNYASYHNPSGSTLMLQRVIIEKPIPMPNRSSGFAPLDSSTASSSLTASLTIG